MAITITTILPAQVQQTFDTRILSTPTSHLIHSIAAEKRRMPRHGGRFLRMSRYTRLPTAPVPLGNTGVTPAAITPQRVDIDVKIDFYGQIIIINEQVTLQAQDAVLTNNARLLGQSLRETEDELIRDMLAGSAAVINCTAGANGDGPTELSAADVAVVVQTLLGNDAKTVAENIEAMNKFGTAPIRNAWFALAHSDISSDLNDVNGFVHSAQYPQQKNIGISEWGNVQNLRFMLSSRGSITRNASVAGDDVYNIFCVGMEAYTMVEQDGASAEFIYRPPIYDSGLAMNASAAWKMGFGCGITNDLWVLNMRATRMN